MPEPGNPGRAGGVPLTTDCTISLLLGRTTGWRRAGLGVARRAGLRAKGPAASVPCLRLWLACLEPSRILKLPLLQLVGLLIQLETSRINSRQPLTSPGVATTALPRWLPPSLSLTASSLRHGCCSFSSAPPRSLSLGPSYPEAGAPKGP